MPDEGRLQRPGVALRFVQSGEGRAVLFQHGLGGDAAQVAEVFPDGPRRLTLECRAHGGSEAGTREGFSIAAFADDVLALADRFEIARFVVGGISMGAAIALRLATLIPDRVQALVLVRPAWLFDAAPANMRPFAAVAEHLLAYPPAEAARRFAASETALHLAEAAPDNLVSLMGFFQRPQPMVTAELLGRIAADGPGVRAAQIAAPALVIGNDTDYVHPLALARTLAQTLANADFVQVTAKARDRAAHAAEVKAAIRSFLDQHPPS